MKIQVFFLLFLSTLLSEAQSDFEQNLYGNNIWKEVVNSRGVVEYYDSNDVVIGSKKSTTSEVNYYNARLRVIKKVPIKTTKQSVVQKSKAPNKVKSRRGLIKVGNLYVKNKRNKTLYYDANGKLQREVRKKGRKIYYKNEKGELVGYKIRKTDGKVEYRDPKGRLTGTSFLNQSGFVVYTSYRNRATPSFMVSDAYFL